MNIILKRLIRFGISQSKKSTPRRFQNRQALRQKILTTEDKKLQYNPYQALALMRLHSFTSFQQSVDLCIKLGVNPKIGQQIVRGTARMPSGLGKDITVAVLCPDDQQLIKAVKQAGANILIDQQHFKNIKKGQTPYDKLFTTPELLPALKPFGKTLGPRGLMPNQKVGTLVHQKKLAEAIKQAKEGQVTFRVDFGKNLHAPLGKLSFTDQQIMINFKSLMQALIFKKPESFKKGKYFIQAYIKTTMGPRWRLKLQHIDPLNVNNIWNLV